MIMFVPSSERQWGHLRDLLTIFSVFLALKLDGLVAMSWSATFLVPWVWFGTLLLGFGLVSLRTWQPARQHFVPDALNAELRHGGYRQGSAGIFSCLTSSWRLFTLLQLAGMIIAVGRRVEGSEKRLPYGFLCLVGAAVSQLPGWIALSSYLDAKRQPSMQVGPRLQGGCMVGDLGLHWICQAMAGTESNLNTAPRVLQEMAFKACTWPAGNPATLHCQLDSHVAVWLVPRACTFAERGFTCTSCLHWRCVDSPRGCRQSHGGGGSSSTGCH